MPTWLAPEKANAKIGESQDEFETIHVRRQMSPYDFGAGPVPTPFQVVCIQFSEKELRHMIGNDGKVYLTVMGVGWPPVLLTVDDVHLIHCTEGNG